MSGIPFNVPNLVGKELWYVAQAHARGQLAGDGLFTKRCERWLEAWTKSPRVLLTHSCTAALEMAALLLDVKPGDEIIMPSFTFVSTANAFALRGATPVFVDIDPIHFNIDPSAIEAAISPRTKAVVPVHYAGVSCQLAAILALAGRHSIAVVEDAAQAMGSSFEGRALGTLGCLGALSFHETKNVISGEGGALLVNDPALIEQAEVIREKGTNRSKFFRGEVDKYTWVEVGSSFLPGEIIAAFLFAQLEQAEHINAERWKLWDGYHARLGEVEALELLTRPQREASANAHMYQVLLPRGVCRDAVLAGLKAAGVHAVFHYVPLHSSPAGLRLGRTAGSLAVTDDISERLIRLPMWLNGLDLDQVCAALTDVLKRVAK